jgi:fructose-1,6-bisphosphatase/inositol monophosphatase family enzyme
VHEFDPIVQSAAELERSNHEQMAEATAHAAIASMRVVNAYQMGEQETIELADKPDASLLTKVDYESERAAIAVLRDQQPHVPILGEETGMTSDEYGPNMYMVDPIDGTRPFVAGAPTSTAIVSLYSNERRQLTAATIVEPATGRAWYTSGNQTMRTVMDPRTGQEISPLEPCHVWEGSITDNPTVLVDNFAAFARGEDKRQIFNTENVVRLFSGLQQEVAIQNYGSNGLHQALVANGGGKLAGSITTAMGGEWDASGALLVINAGGVAEGFRVNADRSLSLADPLDPFSYDILITANNEESLAFLRQKVIASFA